MLIQCLGHSKFLLTLQSGYRIVTDPFDASTGYPVGDTEADAVLVSHHHSDHDAVDTVKGYTVVIDSEGVHTLNPQIRVRSLACFHDDQKGALRGNNLIHCIEAEGMSVVESFVGHGVGRTMHEAPQVPNFVYPEFVRYEDFQIKPGLVIAVEPMVNLGTKRVKQLNDYWTIVTADGSLSAHEEHTIGILKSGPFVLTGPPQTEEERKEVEVFFDRYENNK